MGGAGDGSRSAEAVIEQRVYRAPAATVPWLAERNITQPPL